MRTSFDKEKMRRLEKDIEHNKEVLKHHRGDESSKRGIRIQIQQDEEDLKKLKSLYK